MYIKPIIVMAFTLLCAASCGKKSIPASSNSDTTEVSFATGDSVLYGYAGAECSDSMLDLIQPPADPKHFSVVKARRRGRIIGNFLTGDRITITLSPDGKNVERAIDLSSLIGRWVTGDSIGDPASHGFSLGEDGHASNISTKLQSTRYRNWNINTGKLVISKSELADTLNKTPLLGDTFDIISLVGDTLILKSRDSIGFHTNKYVKTLVVK